MKRQLKWLPVLFTLASGTALACPFDLGDAPSPYPTLYLNVPSDDGARHAAETPLTPTILGSITDCEADGIPSAAATGDDLDADDDEDGVALQGGGTLDPNVLETFEVTVSGADGRLDAFCDYNDDGDWNDGGEKIADNVSVTVAGSPNLITTTPPVSLPAGGIFCRFRISSVGGLGPTGDAPDGEVEDYLFDSTPVELMEFKVD